MITNRGLVPCPLGEMESRRIYGLGRIHPIKEAFKQIHMALGHESNLFKGFIQRFAMIDDLLRYFQHKLSLETFTHSCMAHDMMQCYKRLQFPPIRLEKK